MARSIHIDLLGTQTRFVCGERYTTRIIEVRNDKLPLILLHGGGRHAETYSRNLNSLSAVAPELWGTSMNSVTEVPTIPLAAPVHSAGARSQCSGS